VLARTLSAKKYRWSGGFRHITARAVKDAAFVATLALGASACDIVQGFENAGDALFPPQKTYLEAPGFRLARGGFHRLNVGIGDELYLLARNADPDSEPGLYAMRYLDPKPCRIPNVGRYWSSGLATPHPSQIVYLEGQDQQGTVHFADSRCKIHDFVLENSNLPFEETQDGLLMFSGSDLMQVDPPSGRVRTLASGVQGYYPNGPGANFLVIGGKVTAYEIGTWEYIDATGEGVVGSLRGLGAAYAFEDQHGIHAVTAGALPTPVLNVTDIDRDGCRLGTISSGHLAYYSPCADARLSLYDASSSRTTHLDIVADPSFFAIERDPDRSGTKVDEDYFYYMLRDVQPTGVGTLVVRTPEGEEFVLGEGARLDRTDLDSSGKFGLALLDVGSEVGRLVRWNRDGTTETIATGVLKDSSDLIVNWNGVVGDRARLTEEGELEILLRGVPRRDYEYQDQSKRWHAVFDQSDGVIGTLSIDESDSRTFAHKKVIATGVRHPRHQFLDVVLPGIAFISNYTLETDTGRLEYKNLELDFRGTISEGVSDFIPAGNGLLYTVPFGSARGVWIARAQ
jgi:hypothetical protein